MKIEELIERNPEKFGGMPVFPGTRVPIKHLFDYLEGGNTLATFLQQFPTVSHDQALAVLGASRDSLFTIPADRKAQLQLMREAANDELFQADLKAAMEDFKHVDHPELRR